MASDASENLPGAASRQDLTHRQRELQRFFMRALPHLRRLDRARHELVRRLRGRAHVVRYFHQVDDPYSQLALAAIPRLAECYAVEFEFHLVSPTDRVHAPEPERLAEWARRDCGLVAPWYGLEFPRDAEAPDPSLVRQIERALAGRLGQRDFLTTAPTLGRALWHHDESALSELTRLERAQTRDAERVVAQGNRLRAKLGHYSGGMFWYAGDWYWGVDRLHHLERRLVSLGANRRDARDDLCFPRPPIDPGPLRDDGRLVLEIFPSLRSPYTAFIFETALAVARQAGVRVELRPVMPMVMRGVPAPAAKGIYIMLDAKREADHLGIPFGDMYDPIGKAVLRGFSLWPFARAQGREADYIATFLRAAFVEGRRTDTDAALRHVVETAGLSWDAAQLQLDSEEFRDELEANRRLLYDELGLWGVPSFRLRGPEGEPDLSVWGQDRLWLVAAEIRRRVAGGRGREGAG